MTGPLDGQVALVTGSSRGISFATAEALGLSGAAVVLNGRDKEALDTAVSELVEQIQATGHVADVSDEDAVRAMFDEARTTFGLVDVRVNNAGALAVGECRADDFSNHSRLKSGKVHRAT